MKLHQRIDFRYGFNPNIVNMGHTNCFETHQSLIYHLWTALKPIVCTLCHINSYSTPSTLSNPIKLHQNIPFRYSFNINIVNMRHTTSFDTHRPLIYHLCTALRPIVYFMSYNFLYDPLSLFQFR